MSDLLSGQNPPVPPLVLDFPVADDPPPFLRRWRNIYFAVLIYLAALISLLYALTRLLRYR